MNGVDGKVRPSVLAVTGATNKDRTETPYTIQNSHARTQIHEKGKKITHVYMSHREAERRQTTTTNHCDHALTVNGPFYREDRVTLELTRKKEDKKKKKALKIEKKMERVMRFMTRPNSTKCANVASVMTT